MTMPVWEIALNVLDLLDLLSSDDEDTFNLVLSTRRERTIQSRIDNFHRWDDYEFTRRFRLSKEAVIFVLQKIEGEIKSGTTRNNAVNPLDRLLLALRFYATGGMHVATGDFIGVSTSSACTFVHVVTNAIASRLRHEFIAMPETQEEIETNQLGFYSIDKFPRVVAAVVGTHVELKSPGGRHGELYQKKKGWFSLNVQCLCDADLRILDVDSRWQRSGQDQTIWDNSFVKMRFENGEFGDGIVLADGSYADSSFLVTPLRDPSTNQERRFQDSFTRTREPAERLFEMLRRRFPVLQGGIRISLARARATVVATAILHNICLHMDVPDVPPMDVCANVGGVAAAAPQAVLPEAGDDALRRLIIRSNFS